VSKSEFRKAVYQFAVTMMRTALGKLSTLDSRRNNSERVKSDASSIRAMELALKRERKGGRC